MIKKFLLAAALVGASGLSMAQQVINLTASQVLQTQVTTSISAVGVGHTIQLPSTVTTICPDKRVFLNMIPGTSYNSTPEDSNLVLNLTGSMVNLIATAKVGSGRPLTLSVSVNDANGGHCDLNALTLK